MTHLVLRPAHPDDGVPLHALHHLAITQLCAADYTPEQLKVWTAAPVESYAQMAQSAPLCLVAEQAGDSAGYIALRKNWHIWQLYVHHAQAKQGIGRALLTAAENWLQEKGEAYAQAEASLTALPFYQRCGYQLIARSEVVFAGVTLPTLAVRKELRPL